LLVVLLGGSCVNTLRLNIEQVAAFDSEVK